LKKKGEIYIDGYVLRAGRFSDMMGGKRSNSILSSDNAYWPLHQAGH
jgi:hypothetical protein